MHPFEIPGGNAQTKTLDSAVFVTCFESSSFHMVHFLWIVKYRVELGCITLGNNDDWALGGDS